LFAEEERDDLPLVNLLRDDVRRWRQADYRGASNVTKELLRFWANPKRGRRLFFCQLEAVETIIYLAELRIPGKSSRTGFKNFALSDENLARLLKGERLTGIDLTSSQFFPTLIDRASDSSLLPLQRMGCKMATGSGKTVVMAMLISWAFCNRGVNKASQEFPNAVLVCCPNLTVKERLQVHSYEPDFLVQLINDVTLILEIKGFEVHNPEQTHAKHNSARKWVTAVNNLSDFGKWDFMVCRDVELLLPTIAELLGKEAPVVSVLSDDKLF